MSALVQAASGIFGPAAITPFYANAGPCLPSSGAALENQVGLPYREAGTFSNLRVYVTNQLIGGQGCTVRLKKNGSNGNQAVSFTNAQTGAFEDVTNTDSVSPGDYFVFSMTEDTGPGISFSSSLSAKFTPTNGSVLYMRNGTTSQGGGNVSAGATRYNSLPAVAAEATESDAQDHISTPCTVRDLAANFWANTSDGTTTVRSRINGADGNCVLTVGAGVTGLFEDSTHSDAAVAGDLVNTSIVNGSANGVITGGSSLALYSTSGAITATSGGGIRSRSASATTPLPAMAFGGGGASDVAISQSGFVSPLSHLGVNVLTNTIAATSVLRSRVNAANGNLACSIPASTTGVFEDTSNTDSISSTDLVNVQFALGAGGTALTHTYMWLQYGSTGGGGGNPWYYYAQN